MFDTTAIEKISHAHAFDSAGEKVGKVGQVYADNETNQPTFVTVRTGLFGTHESFVPLDGARLEGEDLHLAQPKDLIKDAPRVEEDGELTPQEEDRLYAHYGIGSGHGTAGVDGLGQEGGREHGREHDGPERRTSEHDERENAEGDRRNPGDTQTVTAHEERLVADGTTTQSRETGRARLRRYTTTEHQTVEVPTRTEKLVVEREDASGVARPGGLEENDVVREDSDETITLREERPVVGKETVETERVRVGTETVEGTERVESDVRKEHIDIDSDNSDSDNR